MSYPNSAQPDLNPSPAPPSKAGSKNVLLKGCAIGCGALIVLAIFAGIGGYYLFQSGMSKVATAMSEQLVSDFDAMKEAGTVPQEHLALYQELVDDTQKPEASFSAVVLATAVVKSHLEDGSVDATELEEAEVTRDFLAENPGLGLMKLETFVAEHEGIRQKVENVKRTMNPATMFGSQ